MRIAYFVHGRGRGHASRALEVLPKLEGLGFEVHVYAAGDARALLSERVRGTSVPSSQPGPGLLRAFGTRVRGDVSRLRSLWPEVVVSDGDGPSVHAAVLCGVPSLAVGHGLIFGHCDLPPGLPYAARLRERANAASSSWPCRRRVAVHFAALTALTPGTYVARPDLRSELRVPRRPEGFLLAYFRDDNGHHELARLARRGHRIVCFGEPSARVAGVEYRPVSARAFATLLPHADAVVGSAGNHLPAECAMLGVPMLALYRPDDSEHRMNAALIEQAGIGPSVRFGAMDDTAMRRFEARLGDTDEALARRTRALAPASEVISEQVQGLVAAASTAATAGWPPARS